MEIVFSGFAGIATIGGLTLGLVQVAKTVGLPKPLLPLLGILVGLGLSFTANGITGISALLGIYAALSAMGLYSGGKTMLSK